MGMAFAVVLVLILDILFNSTALSNSAGPLTGYLRWPALAGLAEMALWLAPVRP